MWSGKRFRRNYSNRERTMADAKEPGFSITGGKGFHVSFENGWTVSVQFGGGNYCEHYDDDIVPVVRGRHHRSTDAETGVFGPSGGLVEYDLRPGDTVQARMSPAEVLQLLNWAAAQPAEVPVG